MPYKFCISVERTFGFKMVASARKESGANFYKSSHSPELPTLHIC